MRAASCSRPAGPRSTRSTASRRRWRSSSACRAAAARARWPRPPRSGTSCACCGSSSACSIACTTARRCAPQSAESIAAQLLRDHRGQHVGLLAPLVVNRKGVYTDLAKWAKARGHTHLRVDGEFLKVDPFPRIDRFKEHTIELPVGDLVVDAGNEAELRALLAQALDTRQGRAAPAAPAGRPGGGDGRAAAATAGIGAIKVFSTKRACPVCGTSYPELDPRMFSYNSKHGWCTHLRRHRPGADARAAQGLDDSSATTTTRAASRASRPRRPRSRAWSTQPCPDCDGTRLNPTARGVHLRRPAPISSVARAVGAARRGAGSTRAGAGTGRDADIARDVVTEIAQPAGVPGGGRPGLPDAGPRRADAVAAARRSASAWRRSSAATCRACATCSTSRRSACTRATTASCSTRWPSSATRATRWSSSSTTRTRSAAPTTSSTSAPAPASAAAALVAQGSVADLSAQRRLGHRPLPGAAAATPAAGAARRWPPTRRRCSCAAPRCTTCSGSTCACRCSGWSRSPGVSGSGKSTLARDVLLANVAALVSSAASRAPDGLRRASTAGRRSTACSRSTRRRSARRRAPARPPTSASGTRSASSSPRRWRPRRAATRRRAFPSTPARAAARAAKARACAPSR